MINIKTVEKNTLEIFTINSSENIGRTLDYISQGTRGTLTLQRTANNNQTPSYFKHVTLHCVILDAGGGALRRAASTLMRLAI